ncbi:VOC family protein [Legionella clemsonensis]|uniref:Metallothiol transferase FosB 2 n=1 Tax=Legionella clemsonensis TaxID=1867846 RepID=A0A222P480_9GAMM|nr:VOC family protein [Legionella clemsonensis]ASQ46656.1 Metallothiol transferase FosB 2 [Legionella clemsonensis]
MEKANLIGINHIALEVANVEKALEFYSKIFNFTLRSKDKNHAFIDLGDQFIALMKSNNTHKDKKRHFGLVVDDRSKVKELAQKAGAEFIGDKFLDFLDPWGNYIQVIEYANIQFTKAPEILAGMNLNLYKNEEALQELRAKGMRSND